MKSKILIFCLMLVTAGCKDSNEPGDGNITPEPPSDEWINYTEENSRLISNSIHCITVDGQGNKWIGTGGSAGASISVFDGTNWINYTTENSGLLNNDINCITIDAQDNKWIGTTYGVNVFDGVNWTSYKKENSDLLNNNVRCITIDA